MSIFTRIFGEHKPSQRDLELQAEELTKRSEARNKARKLDAKAEDTYCAIQGSNCIASCRHFQYSRVYNWSDDDSIRFHVEGPECKLWRSE